MKVGVVVTTDEDSAVGRIAPPGYTKVRGFALDVEAAGFDSIWLYDHMLFRPHDYAQGAWECWTFLSALAEATTSVELGTLVTCTNYRNPVMLAFMASTVEEISNGRLILGLGAGWNEAEFDALGIAFDHKVSRFEEALQIIIPLLREGRVDFDGRYFKAIDTELVFRGPRPGGPPILIASLSPRMLRLAACHADMWNFGLWENLSTMLPKMQEVCDQVGRDMTTLDLTFVRLVVLPDVQPLPDPPPAGMRASISGSPLDLAAALQAYDEAGIAHVMLDIVPNDKEALEQVAEGLRMYRSGNAPPPTRSIRPLGL